MKNKVLIDFKHIQNLLFDVGINVSAFGLDIGLFSIKAVEIKKSWPKKETHLSFGIVDVPEQGESAEAIVSAIKQCVQNSGITSERVNLSLSGPNIITRYILLPKMQEKDLVTALEFELTKYIPHKLEDMAIDYQVIDKSLDNQMAILVVGAERSVIAKRVELVKQAGLKPQSINVDCFAIIEAFQRANPAGVKNGAVALLDIGHKISKLAVLENEVLRFSRDIMLGGCDLTREISERMNVDLKAAEELKRSSQGKQGDVDKIIKLSLNNILDEIRLSFDYCGRFIQSKITNLYLSGGGARLKGIDLFLNSALKIEVNFWNPLSNFQISHGMSESTSLPSRLPAEKPAGGTGREESEIMMSSLLAVAVGLAL